MTAHIGSLIHTKGAALEVLALAAAQAEKASGATVLGLYGDLGSGKTTFTQFLGAALGIEENMVSPTFVIEKIYKVKHAQFDHLIHIDAYRIEHSDEMIRLGWREITENSRNIIVVEWPEKIADILPANHMRITFEFVDEDTRKIEIDDDTKHHGEEK